MKAWEVKRGDILKNTERAVNFCHYHNSEVGKNRDQNYVIFYDIDEEQLGVYGFNAEVEVLTGL